MTTTTTATLFTLYCPRCGHDDIAGGDTLPGLAGITGWRDNPVTGKPEPEWEGSTEVLWNQQRPTAPEAPYCCRRCGAFFAVHELHRQRRKRYRKKPTTKTIPPIARVVIVMDEGTPQVLYASEHVTALVIDKSVLVQQVRGPVAPGALADGPAGKPVAVAIQREFVDSLFSGQV